MGSGRSEEFPLQTQVFFWNPSFLFSPFPLSSRHFSLIPAIGVTHKLLLPASKGSFSRGNTAAFPRLPTPLVRLSGETLVWCLKVSLKVFNGQPQSLRLPIYSQHKMYRWHSASQVFPSSLCLKPPRAISTCPNPWGFGVSVHYKPKQLRQPNLQR